MQLIDTHCHLDHSDFDNDRESIIQACIASGITSLINPGLYPAQWKTAQTLFKQHKEIFTTSGIHPCFIKQVDPALSLDTLKSLTKTHAIENKSIALGECGLDANSAVAMEHQHAIFTIQVELAAELELPLIIHHRKTHNDIIEILRKFKPVSGGVIHAFSGSYEIAKTYWDMGFYLGIGGTITYPRANKTREAIKKMPIEALLLETDSPDMPLNGFQGLRNDPRHLHDILQSLGQLTHRDINTLAQQTTLNAQKLFGIQA